MRKKKASGQEENESEALRHNESWLRLIMENTSDGINITEYDPQMHRRRLVLCNDRYVEMSGRSRKELMEAEDLDQFMRMNPADGRLFHESVSKMLPLKGTSIWLCPDGGETTFEWTAVPLKVGGKYHIVGIDRDVTEQRRVEEALRASELQYQTTLNSIGDAIHVVDKDLRIVLCNPALVQWCGQLGLETNPVGKTIFEAFPLLPKKIRDEFHHVFQTGERFVCEETTIIGDEEFNTETRKIPILDKGKVVQIITVIRDISDRKRAEEALQASEVQYRTTLNSMRDAIHVVDKDLRIVLCNPALEQWCRKVGLESKLEGLTVFEAFPFLPEGVRDEYHHVFQSGKTLIHEETNAFDNEEYKVEARKIPILNKGKVVQIVTVIRDITERKKTEDRIRRLAMIAEQAVEGIGVADLDGVLQFVNPSWARMHGYETGEELLGEHISVFHTAEQMKTYVNKFNEEVKRTGWHMGESEQTRKDGTTFPSEMAITLFKNEEGEPVGMLAFAMDITKRKQAEKSLRESEYDLRMRVRELNCLYNITEVVNKYHDSLESLLQGIVNILPQACQRPESACAKITVSGKNYRTGNFKESQAKLAANILVAGENIGVVEVFCLKANLPVDKNPFLKEEKYLIDTIAARIGRNIERIQTQRQLLAEQSALEHKNVALREVMTGVQDEKKEFGRRVVGNVEKIIMPLLHTLEQELHKGQRKYLDLLKESIEDITLPFADSLSKEFTSLTPTEIRICNLIRRGMSTKQIAGLHHISSATVNKHREHIRRKLRITNKDVNLVTYLENYMSAQAEK